MQEQGGKETSKNLTRIQLAVLAILAFFVTGAALTRLAMTSAEQLTAQYDLVFETPNRSTVELLKEGENPYSPDVYSQHPFIITIYTPLYHCLLAALPDAQNNRFFTGRLISLISSIAIAILLLFSAQSKFSRWSAFLAVGVLYSIPHFCRNSVFLKNDFLALFFAVSCVVFVDRFRQKSWAPIISAMIAILALATKQSLVAPGLTAGLFYGITCREQFVRFCLATITFTLGFCWIVQSKFGVSFWFCTIEANQLSMTFMQGVTTAAAMFSQPAFPASILMILFLLHHSPNQSISAHAKSSPFPIYFLLSSAVALLTIWKLGSSTNYFFEMAISALLWMIFLCKQDVLKIIIQPVPFLTVIVFMICCLKDPLWAQVGTFTFATPKLKAQMQERHRELRNHVSASGIQNPKILNLVTHLDIYPITDEVILNDPYLYYLIFDSKKLDPNQLAKEIQKQKYDLILMPINLDFSHSLAAPPKSVIQEVLASYKLARSGSRYGYYTPE